MVILFNSQHALGITSALNFWYAFSDLFTIEINVYFLRIFVKYFFFKLFLHWSSNVRESLAYFLSYRVLYNFEKRKDLPALERICIRLNRYLNLIKKVGEKYSFERYKWENKTKLERRRTGLDAVKSEIIKTLEKLPPEQLTDNFFPQSEKFTHTFEKPRKGSEGEALNIQMLNIISNGGMKTYDEDNFDQSLLSIKDSKKSYKIVEMRDYRVKLTANRKKSHRSLIKVKNVSYCLPALSDFKRILEKFYTVLKNEGDIGDDSLPKLSLKILIDEFEFIDTDEYEW